jgi:hypothetical protein
VGNRNPHPRHPNDAATSVVIAEKQEDAATSVVIAEKQEDAATLGICDGEPNHVGTPASAELSNDVESGVQALLEGLFHQTLQWLVLLNHQMVIKKLNHWYVPDTYSFSFMYDSTFFRYNYLGAVIKTLT